MRLGDEVAGVFLSHQYIVGNDKGTLGGCHIRKLKEPWPRFCYWILNVDRAQQLIQARKDLLLKLGLLCKHTMQHNQT